MQLVDPPLFRRYARFLPPLADRDVLTLGEGRTPLVPSRWLGPRLGIPNLWFKLEMTNPTGSYKDRFAALEVSLLRVRAHTACVSTSSGNTGAALAAYCAAAGMRCVVFLTESTPDGKLAQMEAHGAELHRVRGFGTSAADSAKILERLAGVSRERRIPLVVSAYAYCPDGMEGVKTVSYEIVEQLGTRPADVFVPVGGGGLCAAIARGFDDLAAERRQDEGAVRIHAVQPVTNDTIVTPWRLGLDRARPVAASTAISGLAVPHDVDGSLALRAVRASGGTALAVEEGEIYAAQRDLCRREGLYVEPAGAAAVAGLARAARAGTHPLTGPVVCILTGHGLKSPPVHRSEGDGAPADLIDPDEIGVALGG